MNEIWSNACVGVYVKYLVEFLTEILKNQILNFMKIRPLGIELYHAKGPADRQKDRHKEANLQFYESA
jgi:hypothetical protein